MFLAQPAEVFAGELPQGKSDRESDSETRDATVDRQVMQTWASVFLACGMGLAATTLLDWVKRSEIDSGMREGAYSGDCDRCRSAWLSPHRDQLKANMDWQFTTDAARVKLKRLYPTIEVWRDTR